MTIFNAATGVFTLNFVIEQLLAFLVIDVLIERLYQQFSAFLDKSHHLTCGEFINSAIKDFGLALSRVFSAALLFCDENAREQYVRN